MPLGEGQLASPRWATAASWNSTDQVPLRAIDSGLIGRFGTLDASDGGESSRYSLSADYAVPLAGGEFQTTAYWFKYRLNLYSNFTYFLNDPVNGDQFEQADDRNVYGWTGEWTRRATLFDRPDPQHAGLRAAPGPHQAGRAVRHAPARAAFDDTREDDVVESSAGVYASNDTRWTDVVAQHRRPALRPLPLRRDEPEHARELRRRVGRHLVAEAVAGVRALGADRILRQRRLWLPQQRRARRDDQGRPGHRRARWIRRRRWCAARAASWDCAPRSIPNLQSSLSLWYLSLDSELVFIGDAGNTEAGRPSRRYGVEWSNRWRALPWMLVDLDVAWNHARFTEDAPEGNYVPGAPDWVVAAGVSVPRYGPWSGAVFLRYIGSYPLTEDNSVRSDAQTVFDAQAGYELAPRAAASAGRLQPVQHRNQRHQLLLQLAPARRAGGRRR